MKLKHILITSILIAIIPISYFFDRTDFTEKGNINTVNPVIGDASFHAKFGVPPDASTDEFTRVQTHLSYAEELLRKKDISGLSLEQQKSRIQLLDLLHEYWQAGKFPANTKYENERRPCFIDANGTICAVGYLVEQTAGRSLAERINQLFQYATISEMILPELNEWISESGFTPEEIATIQPTYNYMWTPPSRVVLAGGGMSTRSFGAGYPAFDIGIENEKGKSNQSVLLRYESLGPEDNLTGLRFGIAKNLFRQHLLGIGITPSFFLDNNHAGANIKPDLALSLVSGAARNMSIQMIVSYGYDFALSQADYFPISRHDLSVHLLLRLGKGTRFRDY